MADIKDNKEKLSNKGIIIIASVFIVIFAVLGYMLVGGKEDGNVGASDSSVKVKGDSDFDGTLISDIDKEVKEQKEKKEKEDLKNAEEKNEVFVSDLDKDTKVITTSDLNVSFNDIEKNLSPCEISEYDEDGFHCETGLNKDGYDRDGFNELGLDVNGCDKNGLDLNGNSCISNLEGKECNKAICEELIPIYNEEGYDREGYDRQGYDKEGYDREGYDKNGYDREGYDKDGYDKEGFNKEGYDRQGYDKEGYDKEGYDRNGYDRNGYDKEGYDREGYDKNGYDREGYDREGFNKEGYDREGFNREGCNREGLDRTGSPCKANASVEYDKFGYDTEGYDREGYDKYGYDREGYDREGFNRFGCNKEGLNRLGNPCQVYDADGYDEEGYDREGYDREGYDRKGYDRDGFNRFGCNAEGLNRKGEPCKNEYINGFDMEGYDRDGCDKNGLNRAGLTCLDSHRVKLTAQEKLWYEDELKTKLAYINQIKIIEPMEYDQVVNVKTALKEVLPEEENSENSDNSSYDDDSSMGTVDVENGSDSGTVAVDENNDTIEIPTGSMLYASLVANVNSDYPGIVRARIIGGPLNGALFIGSFGVPFIDDPYRPRDKMQFNFDKFVYKRKTYTVNAIGMDLDSLNDYVSSYADNHYVTRWGGLIIGNLLKGMGKAAYGSGTTGTSDSVVTTTPITETKEQLKVSIGEIGNELSTIAKEQFYRPPTVVSNRGKTIGIYFVTEVNNDELPILFNNKNN